MKPKDILQDLIDKTGENPNSLAAKTNVGQSTIQRLLAGATKEPRRGTLEPIARFYGFPVEMFFQGKPIELGAQRAKKSADMTGGDVVVWDKEEDLPQDDQRVWVDRWDYSCSAGDGMIQWEIRQKAALPFTLSFFKAIGSKPENCKLLVSRGDSMEPFLFNRDMIMVDVSKTNVRDGLVYAVSFEDEPLVKQLFKQPGGALTLHSYNTRYPDRTVSPTDMERLEVIGEVVYRSGSGFAGH